MIFFGLSFMVDACSVLLERAGTVGLFRKPGSLPRIKTLRVRLNLIKLLSPCLEQSFNKLSITYFVRECVLRALCIIRGLLINRDDVMGPILKSLANLCLS